MSDHTDRWRPYALAFETSSALGSVALGSGPDVSAVAPFSGPRRHAAEFLPTIAQVCRAHGVLPADVGAVYVSSGPGSFTGLRIGITAARMIALATDARLVNVPTLDVVAQNALHLPEPPERVAVILDAKRGRVYAASFIRRTDRYVATDGPTEADPREFLAAQAALPGTCVVLGEGVIYHRQAVDASKLATAPADLFAPRAETVYRLGHWAALEDRLTNRRALIPTYIRPPEAEEKWEQREKVSG